jgi:hypothetical protein
VLFARDQLQVRYYLLPEDTHMGRQRHHGARELFLGTKVLRGSGGTAATVLLGAYCFQLLVLHEAYLPQELLWTS